MNSEMLSEKRTGTVINTESKVQEKTFVQVVKEVIEEVSDSLGVELVWKKRMYNRDIIKEIPNGHCESQKSFITPDGGFTFININDKLYPVFIGEVKKQGTNTKRIAEGQKRQAQGNAIERLGKNIRAIESWLWNEDIFPFVCFGYGCDFEEGSSIRERVISMNHYSELNVIYNRKGSDRRSRASMFFQGDEWTETEMKDIIREVMIESIEHYRETKCI